MIRTARFFAWTSLAACATLSLLVGSVSAAERPSDRATPPNPVRNGVQPVAQIKVPADGAKEVIELPTKIAIGTRSATPSTGAGTNPRVEPGQVRWHAALAAACAAAQKSGKPVLLFQMMGKLDEQFC